MDKSSSSNKKEERRMSSTGAFAGPSSKETSKENKRPLITVFSENKLGTNSTTTPGQVNDNNIGPSVSQKQSFLSRFASAEARSSIAAAAAAFDQFSPSPLGHKSSSTTTTTTTTTKSNFVLPDTQCDNKSKPASLTPPISTESKSNEDVHEDDVNKHGPLQSTSKKTSEKVKEKQRMAEPSEHFQDNRAKEDNEDNDQVLPVWPSRIEARSMEPAGVQHQVYSLKDYSQVSGPTKQPTTQQPQTGGRLLKSMSQDRKIKSNAKRMSECIYSSQQNRAYMSVSGSNDNQKSLKQRNSTINDHILTSPGGSFSIQGPAASVNSPLAPTTKNTTLLSESRIDRMRKLFVSPLSLRSSASGSSKALGSHNQSADNPRLSFQAGTNVLHKPHHHLMHAMYRTRAHHSRRSPMRQKQGATKGFRVYGCPLQMANNIYPITCFGRPDIYKQQSVPYILVRLCNYIEETSSHLTHEGIFRVSGNARLMEKLRTLFDRLGDAPLESESVDVATSASMLKMYLRELPEPLIPSRMNYYFIALAKKYSSLLAKDNTNDFKSFDNPVTSSSSRNSTVVPASQADPGPASANQSALDQQRLAFRRDLTKLVRKLPIENYNLLKYLACFLYRISLKQKYNKMCAEALGIVFGPNVFRIRSESYKGLKEQELSNQIMASIISNYKSIFDCELTDPLGNLKLSTEDLPLMAQDEHGSSKRHPTAVENGKVQSSKLPETSVSPLPSTSVSGSDLQDSYPCTKHEHSCYYHNKPGQLSEEGDDEDEEEDDDDDDDETSGDDEDQIEEADDEQDCDDESYSPSSGSSYCSSAESDSVESTYDDEEEEEDENDDGEQVDPEDKYPGEIDSDDMLTDSSSECASDTNYTPSSSHTESDANGDADESPYYRSSSFESSSSFGRQGQNKSEPEGAPAGPLNVAQNQSDNPCRVCRRRESAQIEAHQRSLLEAKFKQASIDQQQQQAVDATSGPETVCDTSTVTSGTQQVALNTSSEVVTLIDDKPDNDVTTAAESNRRLKQHNKSSRRRKQPEEPKKFIDQVKRDLISMNKTSSDQTLNQLEKYADKAAATGDDRFSRRNQSRQAHRPNLLRRRSSSASSLLRIKSRNGRLIAKKTFAGKEDHNQHHPPTHHHHKTRMSHSERRKPHELKTYCRKSRKGHQATKRGEQHSSSTRATAKRSTGGWRDTRLPHEQQQQQVERVTSLEPKSFIWDYTPASLIGLQDCDGMFLRSYNSDETLLRTSDNYLDSDNGPERNYPRRFSDHEHLLIRKQVIPVCERFGEIFEALESEGAIDLGNTIDDQDARSRYEQQHHKDGEHSRLATIEASTVSLLDDRMNNFRHSNLSIEENSQDDVVNPVLNQLRSTKDLIKVLKKALKSNDTKLFNLVKLHSDEENRDERSDDWSLCHLDHLSAASLTGQLSAVNDMTENLMNDEEQNQFKAMINTKLNLLKERYNSTRIIHDHYTKHHHPDEVSKSNQEQHDDRSVNVESTKHQPVGNKRSALSIQENSDLGSSSESLTQMAKLTLAELEVETRLSCSSPSASPEQRNHLVCKFGSLCPVEFVFKIEKQLALKQSSSNRLIKLNEMNSDQLQSEKLELQKNLLRFEHWFGRPSTRLEFQLTGHLYERYRAVKMLKQNRQP